MRQFRSKIMKVQLEKGAPQENNNNNARRPFILNNVLAIDALVSGLCGVFQSVPMPDAHNHPLNGYDSITVLFTTVAPFYLKSIVGVTNRTNCGGEMRVPGGVRCHTPPERCHTEVSPRAHQGCQ